MTDSISCFDLFCTYNSHLVDRLYEADARNVACVPFAWDPDIHPTQPYGAFERDLLFIGNGDTHRAQWLRHILSCPAAKHWKVSIYGKWAKAMCRSFSDRVIHRHVFGLEMAKLIASSRITLNILRVQNEGSHNMRTFETPGCGGLLASQFSNEQSHFLNGEDANQRGALLVSDPEECVDQIERHLRDPKLCESIARIGTARVADQTYQRRAEQTLDALGIASC
ncbi:CgeB family protein [Rhodopirellula baltica]|uniref:CgeB family protein n=1 Tax=Rhodopirellula baltica TaxID=265606 RepID=UPI001360B369|nr:glycosyltransferase [Rhodopirellula baltica]